VLQLMALILIITIQFLERNGRHQIDLVNDNFPSWIQHDTDMVTDSDPRITIAMDFYTEKGFKEDVFEDKKWRWVKI
jgi:hypothetical protein